MIILFCSALVRTQRTVSSYECPSTKNDIVILEQVQQKGHQDD